MKYIKVFPLILFYICNNADGTTEFPPKNISSQATRFNDTTTDNSGEVMTGNLRHICETFGVPISKCTCKLFNYPEEERSACELLNAIRERSTRTNEYHPVFNTVYASMLLIAAIIGMIGNLLVLVVAINHRKDIIDCKKLVALLALYDFMFSLLNLCMAIPKFWTIDWVYGRFLCKVMVSAEYLGTALSIGMILLISAERYIGIVTPFSKGLSDYRLLFSISLNGVIAVVSVTPLFINLEIDRNSNDPSMGTCELKWENAGRDSLIYNSFIMVFYFLIPLIIVSVLNLRIILKLSQRTMLESDSGIADPRQRLKRYKECKRTIIILSAVIISFALLVFPKHLIHILFDLKGWTESAQNFEINNVTYYILLYIAYLPYPFHATVNPIIYSLVGKGWRKKMKRIILRKSRSPSYSTTISTIARRRSSPALHTEKQMAETDEVVELQFQNTNICSKSFTTKRMPHLSDSSAKSMVSNASSTYYLAEPFDP